MNRGDILRKVQPEDLIQYGLIPELIGRLPILATLDNLDAGALVDVLTKPKNALVKQYQKMLRFGRGQTGIYSGKFGSDRAVGHEAGIRGAGLRIILEKILLDTMYELPEQTGLTRVVVDKTSLREQKILFGFTGS
jgi:ATP-dependent Clp protease ATP-binding subunit ClpX